MNGEAHGHHAKLTPTLNPGMNRLNRWVKSEKSTSPRNLKLNTPAVSLGKCTEEGGMRSRVFQADELYMSTSMVDTGPWRIHVGLS